ncbi:MAG: hypothetical protein HY898_23395 [Deltaproteobacteria bacterium]|nr:hypothetical protein [Deltaproteobacteria bacterium]
MRTIGHRSLRCRLVPTLAIAALGALAASCGESNSSGQTLPGPDKDASADAPADASLDALVDSSKPDSEGGSPNACQPNPCKDAHKTVCKEADGGAVCSCDTGYVEESGSCVADVKCQTDSCHSHGTCKVVNQAIECTCQQGWSGPTCDQCDSANGWHADGKGGCTQDPCVPDPCGGDPDKVCKSQGGKAVCECRPGTHEESGDCVPDTTCQANSCNTHGTCSDAGGKVSCSCDVGWVGATCDQCDTMGGWHPDGQGGCSQDPCKPNPCKDLNKTTCTANGGSAQCSCDPGYHDEGGACVLDETCAPNTCNGHGTCQLAGGKISCTCDTGFQGLHCESCAPGWHDDGAGGCTDDPCKPNPCALPHQTVCAKNGTTYSCQCDADAHPDGQGACTTDPCVPNPCAVLNQACKSVGGVAQCYEPDCNDQNPCTTDAKVGGVCHNDVVANGTACVTSACIVGQTCQSGTCTGGGPANCNDGNPCTDDSCDPSTGCHSQVNTALKPDDGLLCTLDSCDVSGVVHHDPSDPLCDDSLFCTGVEKCSPGSPGADAKGCIATAVPVPPSSGSACVTYGACVEGTPHFVASQAPVGTPCDDHIACTTGDACQPAGVCKGTPITGCLSSTCTSTSTYGGAIDVPVSTLEVEVTLGGQPLPAGANPSSDTMFVFLRAADTGALHQVRHLWYTSSGGPWPTNGDHAYSVVPGIYDVLYRRGYNTSSSTVSENVTGDKLPNGYRVLQQGLAIGSGANTVNVDVPVALLDVEVKLDGQPLPSGASSSSDTALFYLRSPDTGALHQVRHLWYTSSGGPWPNTGDHAYSVVPGTYDVIYRRGHSASDNVVSENPDNDKLPNGYRVLQQGLTVTSGANPLSFNVPVALVSAVNVTVDGAPLPSGANPSSSTMTLYLRSKDTGALHAARHLWYTSSGGPWPTNGAHAWSVIPGEYEVVYRRDWSSSTNEVGENPAGDKLPAGYRVLTPSVTLQAGPNTLNVDIPVATLSAVDVTLNGAPLPSGSSSSSSTMSVLLRAKDTGILHQVRHLWYTSSGGPWPTTADHGQSVPVGTYDVIYRRGWSSSTNVVDENDSGDKLPNGYRVLQENVALGPGANALQVNVPVATLSSVTVLLDHASLPSGANASSDTAFFYLRSKDTGVLHAVRHLWYTSSGGPWPTSGDHTFSMIPGAYDLVYRRGWSSSDGIVSENLAQDKLPNGFRVLQENVILNQGSNSLVFDLTQSMLGADLTLDGKPLPSGANPSSDTMFVYLRSRDTEVLHGLRHLWYTSSGGPWPVDGAHARSVPPGLYDLIYRRGWNSSDDTVGENVTSDKLPNGMRVLQRCLQVP